jgi:hypothetical protein
MIIKVKNFGEAMEWEVDLTLNHCDEVVQQLSSITPTEGIVTKPFQIISDSKF